MKSTVMEKIIKLNTIKEYNDFLGIETPHPLVSVIDASKIKSLRHVCKNIGFYVIYLKDIKCADVIKYGRKFYDFQEETLVFAAPGQIIGNDDTRRVIPAQRLVADISARIATWYTAWPPHAGLHVLFLCR